MGPCEAGDAREAHPPRWTLTSNADEQYSAPFNPCAKSKKCANRRATARGPARKRSEALGRAALSSFFPRHESPSAGIRRDISMASPSVSPRPLALDRTHRAAAAIALVAFAALGTPTGWAQSCGDPKAGSCCVEQPSPACSDADCCAAVCNWIAAMPALTSTWATPTCCSVGRWKP